MAGDDTNVRATSPFESEWRAIGDSRYGVYALPSDLPTWVPRWLNGDLASAVIAARLYRRADHPPYSVRLYSQKDVFYNLGAPWRLVGVEEFKTMHEAKARAKEMAAELGQGRVPKVEAPSEGG